jgi:hypothetical protein
MPYGPDVWTFLAAQKIATRMTRMQQINADQPREKSVKIRRTRVIRESKWPRF